MTPPVSVPEPEDVGSCEALREGCRFQGTVSELAEHEVSCIPLLAKRRHEEALERTRALLAQEAQARLEVFKREMEAQFALLKSQPVAASAPGPASRPSSEPVPSPSPSSGSSSSSSSSSSIAPPSFPSSPPKDQETAILKEFIRKMKEYGSGNTWTVKASISSNRCFLSLVSHGNILYCFGGTTENVVHEYLEVYDPATKDWKNMIKMPTPRCGTTAVSLGDYIACLGGVEMKDGKQVLSTKLELFHPASRQWFTGCDMPTARAYFGAAVYDNKIFCFGGLGNDSMTMYNPVGNVWTELGRLPRPRYAFSAIEYKGLIYLVGGSSTDENIRTVDRYDPVSRTFVNDGIVITIPDNWSSRGSAILDDKIYCIGGVSVEGHFTKNVDVYDMKKRTWSKVAPQPEPRSGFGVACVDGAIFCVGGRSGDANSSHDVKDVTAYFPEQNIP